MVVQMLVGGGTVVYGGMLFIRISGRCLSVVASSLVLNQVLGGWLGDARCFRGEEWVEEVFKVVFLTGTRSNCIFRSLLQEPTTTSLRILTSPLL